MITETTIRIDKQTLAEIKRIAYLRGVSVSELIRQELERIVREESGEEGGQRG